MKMLSPFGIIKVHRDQIASRQIEGKPIPGYSLINEVMKRPDTNETSNENIISPRVEAGEDT